MSPFTAFKNAGKASAFAPEPPNVIESAHQGQGVGILFEKYWRTSAHFLGLKGYYPRV